MGHPWILWLLHLLGVGLARPEQSRSAEVRTDHGAEEGAAAAYRRTCSPCASPARAAGAPAGLAALLTGLRDADTAKLRPPAAGAGLGRRNPRESPPAAARPPPVLRRGPPGHAEVLAVATRRTVLLAPHPCPSRLYGAELRPWEGLGHPDLQRKDGERGPGDRTGHVPRLAACAQARGGDLHRFHASVRGYFSLCALPTATPGYDSSRATEKWGHQYGGAHAESGENTHSSLGLPWETSDKEKGQGHSSLKCRNRQAA